MPRVKRSTKRSDRRKKILDRASGYFLTKSKLYQAAQEAVERGLKFAYTGRKQKKRQFRSLWIVRISAAAKLNGTQLFAVHQRPQEGRHRARPQDSGRHRREGRGGLHRLVEQAKTALAAEKQRRSRRASQQVSEKAPLCGAFSVDRFMGRPIFLWEICIVLLV